MKTFYYYLFGLVLSGILLQGCFDDDSSIGGIKLTPIEIQSTYDTIQANFGEKVNIDFVKINQGENPLPLTYEWGWGELVSSGGSSQTYPIKDSLRIISHELELNYAFRKLGTFGLRLKVDNGESIQFKFFVLNVNSGLDEGITVLSRDETGKGRISFQNLAIAGESQKDIPFMTDVMSFTNPDVK